jgi:hypothetical protein
VQEIHRCYFHYKSKFIENSNRKNLFLATCSFIDASVDIELISASCPYGGLIGVDDSKLENILNRFKLFQVHAAFHDACGYMKREYKSGPGYVYAVSCPISNCLLGHITGLTMCSYIKIFRRHLYDILLD